MRDQIIYGDKNVFKKKLFKQKSNKKNIKNQKHKTFRYEHGLGVVREVSVSWNWRLSIVFGKHWSVFGCGLGGVCHREVILKCFFFNVFFEFSFF